MFFFLIFELAVVFPSMGISGFGTARMTSVNRLRHSFSGPLDLGRGANALRGVSGSGVQRSSDPVKTV